MAEETIAAVYLFGSYASETNREDSDIDIAVLYESVPPSTLQGSGQVLASEVEDLLGVEVDLIVLNKADCELVHEILLGGVLVAERDSLKGMSINCFSAERLDQRTAKRLRVRPSGAGIGEGMYN